LILQFCEFGAGERIADLELRFCGSGNNAVRKAGKRNSIFEKRSQEGGQAEFNLIFSAQSDSAPPPLRIPQSFNAQETEQG
jgi:hypothetical protein